MGVAEVMKVKLGRLQFWLREAAGGVNGFRGGIWTRCGFLKKSDLRHRLNLCGEKSVPEPPWPSSTKP